VAGHGIGTEAQRRSDNLRLSKVEVVLQLSWQVLST
jgi:hypothetical protein